MTKRNEFNIQTTKVSMTDLHHGAWWTGLRIDVPTSPQEFLVTMLDLEGISRLHIMTGESQPFQWALPAHVAQQRQMMLHITPILPESGPIPFFQIKLFFEELPPINPRAALHFLCDDYTVAFSLVPRDVVDYVVIPTMKRLYEG